MLIHNYFFLKDFTNAIKALLLKAKLQSAYGVKSDELVLNFEGSTALKLTFIKGNCYYALFQNQAEHHKEAQVRFKHLWGQRVVNVQTVLYERVFFLEFEDTSKLVFRFFGRHSNIFFYATHETLPKEIFRFNLEADKQITIAQILADRAIAINTTIPIQSLQFIPAEIAAWFPTKELNYGEELVHFTSSIIIAWHFNDNQNRLIPTQNTQNSSELLEELRSFYVNSVRINRIEQLKTSLLQSKEHVLKKKTKTIEAASNYLKQLQTQRSPKEIADIIMAHLHLFSDGKTTIVAFDFYTNQSITIRLPENIQNPTKYAEKLYKKNSGIKQEIAITQEKIESLTKQIKVLQSEIEHINSLQTYKELKGFLKISDKQEDALHLPFREFKIGKYIIRIGKNDKSNDQMLAQYSNKNDYWLHAKDYSGSHVLIKRSNPQEIIPENVVITAASWAAWYSKGKNQALLPVIVTERKYVRKGKNLKAGQVIIEKERTVMVQPKAPL
ncbi:MAG: NFACT RNA binding domain-containing protein [Bacteroidia bacterium]|nr:NFACT RNA binding domain-containing protein [Bacteroidia bacterium]